MRRRKMGAVYDYNFDYNKSNSTHQIGNSYSNNNRQQGTVIEEIDGIIKLFRDGHVERPGIMPCVPPSLDSDLGVVSQDIVIDKSINIWARLYVPKYLCQGNTNTAARSATSLPLLVYFHGGGFCVGSASWGCYHEYLCQVAADGPCLIISVNYRLAPENNLPAAYEDGLKAVMWLLIQEQRLGHGGCNKYWWSRYINLDSIFLAGDSAGANIAFNVALRLRPEHIMTSSHQNVGALKPFSIKGMILIQPFFGGEARTYSEKHSVEISSRSSVLSLAASDTYWRLALPAGLNRDHPWCNPLTGGGSIKCVGGELRVCRTLVCISEMDLLKDRNIEFCAALAGANHKVEHVVYKGVGHAFQVLDKSAVSKMRTQEMISHVKDFIHR